MALITIAGLHYGSPGRHRRTIYRKVDNFIGCSVRDALLGRGPGEYDLSAASLNANRVGAGGDRGDNMGERIFAISAAVASGGFRGAFGDVAGRGDVASKTGGQSKVGGGSGHGEGEGTQGRQRNRL